MSGLAFTVRFAVASHTGQAGSIWRLWVPKGKSDVYVAVRNLGGVMKVSLHESGQWRAAFTSEYASRLSLAATDDVPGRVIEAWSRPPPIAAGVTLAFRIVVPTFHLSPLQIPSAQKAKVLWVAPSPAFNLVEFVVMLTKIPIPPGEWPASRSMHTKCLGRHAMPNGEEVWLLYSHSNAQPGWFADLESFKRRLATSRPKLARPVAFLTARRPRIIVGGYYPDGSRYYIDLDARKTLTLVSRSMLFLWALLLTLKRTVQRARFRSSA